MLILKLNDAMPIPCGMIVTPRQDPHLAWRMQFLVQAAFS
jgi:hypothetical protein